MARGQGLSDRCGFNTQPSSAIRSAYPAAGEKAHQSHWGNGEKTMLTDQSARIVQASNQREMPRIRVIWLILALALIVRLMSLAAAPERERAGLGIFGDSFLYNAIAFNLTQGNGFSGLDYGGAYGVGENRPELRYEAAVSRAPLYPVFLASVYSVFGDISPVSTPVLRAQNFDATRVVQCILDTMTCFLVFILTRLIFPRSPWPALIAASIYAFGPYNIYYTSEILSETLASFLSALAAVLTLISMRRGTSIFYAIAGIGWASLALCRPEYLGFCAVTIVFLASANRLSWLTAAKRFTAVLLGVALLLAPWMARNYALTGQPLITVSGLGQNLYLGTFETNSNWLGWNQFPEEIFADATEREYVRNLDQQNLSAAYTGTIAMQEFDRQFIQLALKRIEADPWAVVKNWFTRLPRLWYQFYIPMYRDAEASGLYFLAYFALAGAALVRARRAERVRMMPAVLMFAYVSTVYLPLHIESRYSVPTMPLIISLAGIGAWYALDFLRRCRQRAQKGAIAHIPAAGG